MTAIDQHTSERLLRECRDVLERDLGEWLDELGPVLAGEVLDLIDSTRDETKKEEYLRLRTDLQRRWGTLTAACRTELSRQLQQVKITENAPEEVPESAPENAPEKAPSEKPGFADLQIVSDEDLTEQIVMREFVGRVSEACSEETYALGQRISYMVGGEDQDASDNRLGPATVCAAVRAGCTAMYTDLDQHSLLLRQLERHLRSELPMLYRVINEILVQAEILPTLKRSYRRPALGGAEAATVDAANILSSIERLVQARSRDTGGEGMAAGPATGTGFGGSGSPGAGSGTGFAGSGSPGAGSGSPGVGSGTGFSGSGIGGQALPPGTIAVNAAMFESLQALQAEPAATPGALTNVVRIGRDSAAAHQIPPIEAITLDIVATLFDLIFNDEKISGSIKGLVSRLQIPILKVAMVDQKFFSDRGHPARRFLDSISGISIRWGQTVDEGDPFYIQLSQLVERIQSTFSRDADIFGTAITELTAFVTEHEAIEADASRVVVEIVQRKNDELLSQREQQAAACAAADSALAPLLAGELPRTIEHFLRGHWRAVLQHHALTSGTDSIPFLGARGIAKELAWSVAPKTDADQRKRQAAMLPKIVGGLNQGLEQIGVSVDARRPFMDALMDLTLAAIRGGSLVQEQVPDPVVSQAAVTPPPVAELHVIHSVENGVRLEEDSLPEGVPATDGSEQDRANLRRVKHLVRGDWVEFVDDDGQSRRERLSWISPNRSLFLFSNHAANCAISISPEALVHRLHMDTARLVGADGPMFERALEGAIKALDQPAVEIAG